MRRRRELPCLAGAAFWLGACSLWSPNPPRAPEVAPVGPPEPVVQAIDQEIYRRAEMERAERLEAEVRRLRADLSRAEEALVAAESGLRGNHSRADAVSSLAEVRIQVERAAAAAPWRTELITEARDKLQEADRQIREGHFGAALFFGYRARRIADQLSREASEVAAAPRSRFVRADRVNLRDAPSLDSHVQRVLTRGTPVFPEGDRGEWVLVRTSSGSVGWIHRRLIGARSGLVVPASPY